MKLTDIFNKVESALKSLVPESNTLKHVYVVSGISILYFVLHAYTLSTPTPVDDALLEKAHGIVMDYIGQNDVTEEVSSKDD